MGRLFTWNCTSSKDVETVQQNSEVDLETNQIFPYSELLKDISLEEISRNRYFKYYVSLESATILNLKDDMETKHTWMKALACKHLESSTVTFRPLGVALKMAWSLKAIAFNILDRLRALSRLATNTCSSPGWDWVDRGIVVLKQTKHFIRYIPPSHANTVKQLVSAGKTDLVKRVL